MNRTERKALMEKLAASRGGRLLIVYITSTRPNFEIQIGDDVLRLLRDHLDAGQAAAKIGIDLFIHSNGGSGTVPWRLVSLVREYTKSFAVLVPHKAFSAATLIALGADDILMHRMGCLGPIDPSVANIFNPPHPQNPSQPAPISVEDVSAYFKMVKDEVGITHEDELVQALTSLTDKIHPLALGNVQRHHHQSRLMATRLLKQHMAVGSEHEINKIIDNLKSNLFFHGHPINRNEAKNDLNLKVKIPTEEIEKLMWDLYIAHEPDFKMNEGFNPIHELDIHPPATPPAPLTPDEIIKQMMPLLAAGFKLGAITEAQLVNLAAAMVPHVKSSTPASPKLHLNGMVGARLESVYTCDTFLTDMSVERTTVNTPSGPQEAVKQEVKWQRWAKET